VDHYLYPAADFTDADWHKISVDEIIRRLNTSSDKGLTDNEAAARLKEYGQNTMSRPKSRWFIKTLQYLFGGFGSVLFLASILVFIAWKPLGQPPALANLALAIVLAIVWIVQALFSFMQGNIIRLVTCTLVDVLLDWSSSRVMASIKDMLPDESIVIRNGAQQSIISTNIVPGDILCITMGDKLPADVRFIEVSADAKFDRSVLTVENFPLRGTTVSTDDNFLETACIGMAGTHCTVGTGLGLVFATGDRSVFGRVS
jgi:sodium/potassium-transporting ATPase subunit alpha